MTKFISRGAVLIGAFLSCLPAWAGCTVYTDRDFQGAHWTLKNSSLQMGGQEIQSTNWNIDYQPNWNDKISSFTVTADCTITLWQHAGTQGYGAKFVRSGKNVSYIGDSWNDQASWVDCGCGR